MSRTRSLRLLAPIFTAGLSVGAAASLGADARPPSSATPPAAIPLTSNWRFQADPRRHGRAAGFPRGRGLWQPVTVPSVFDARPMARLFAGTTGWYRLNFVTPATRPGFGWALDFQQARRRADVWLNGRLIGRHADPYTPFRITLPALRSGAPNVLVVRVDNRRAAEPREGWWNWGGLTRPVSLVPLGPVQLSGLGLLPRVNCTSQGSCTGAVLVDGTMINRTRAWTAPAISVTLTAPGGGSTQTATVHMHPVGPGRSTRVHATVPLTGAVKAWAPDHPALYTARVRTLDGPTITQQDSLRIGMRQVEVRNGLLYLNDRQLDVRGASIEEDVPGHGPVLDSGDIRKVIAQLHALHANITRAQYPLEPALLDQLDRAGILLWSQAPIYHRDELLQTPAQRDAALATLRGTLLATRNHPSVIAQSVANELSPTPDQAPATRAYLDAAMALSRKLDPTAPVALDLLSYPNYPLQKTYRRFDVLGINNYFGWYAGRAGHSTAAFAGLTPYLRVTHDRYPTQALVMSEFGAEANVAGPVGVKQTYAFQTRYLIDTLRAVGSLPFMSGAIYWTLREFAVKPHWDGGAHRTDVPRTSIHHKGLISYGGRPKPAFQAAAQAFAQTPLYRTPSGPGGGPPPNPGGPPGPDILVPLVVLLGLLGAGGTLVLRSGRRRGARRQPLPRVDSARG